MGHQNGFRFSEHRYLSIYPTLVALISRNGSMISIV